LVVQERRELRATTIKDSKYDRTVVLLLIEWNLPSKNFDDCHRQRVDIAFCREQGRGVICMCGIFRGIHNLRGCPSASPRSLDRSKFGRLNNKCQTAITNAGMSALIDQYIRLSKTTYRIREDDGLVNSRLADHRV